MKKSTYIKKNYSFALNVIFLTCIIYTSTISNIANLFFSFSSMHLHFNALNTLIYKTKYFKNILMLYENYSSNTLTSIVCFISGIKYFINLYN